jgi:hypothetical protein
MTGLTFVRHEPEENAQEKERRKALVISRAARFANLQRQRKYGAPVPSNNQAVLKANRPLRRGADADHDDHNRLYSGSAPVRPSSPAPRPLKGNSDPFSAHAIQITPEINRLMGFIQESLPQYYGKQTLQ